MSAWLDRRDFLRLTALGSLATALGGPACRRGPEETRSASGPTSRPAANRGDEGGRRPVLAERGLCRQHLDDETADEFALAPALDAQDKAGNALADEGVQISRLGAARFR
jgi:hypothetical protein